MMISFVDIATHTSETHLLRDTGGFDLGRLEQVYQIMQRVCRHEATVSVALSELEAVMRRAPYYSKLAYLTSWGVASGMVAPTAFGGSWVDCGVSLVGGMCVGLMSLLGGRLTAFNNVFQVAASFVVALLARGLHHHVCFTTVVLSGIVVLLPGFMLTLSIMEVSSSCPYGNILSAIPFNTSLTPFFSLFPSLPPVASTLVRPACSLLSWMPSFRALAPLSAWRCGRLLSPEFRWTCQRAAIRSIRGG